MDDPETPDSPLETVVRPDGARAAEAFGRLASETRLAILLALWDAYEPPGDEAALPFSALQKRVGVRDSGQFNYHLEKLTDHFVRRDEAGYVLTNAGFHVVWSVVAGTGTRAATFGPTTVGAACPLCDAPVEVRFENETIEATCTDCDGLWRTDDARGLLFRFDLPPAGIENRTPEEVFDATISYNFHRLASFRNGVCPHCTGTVETSLDVCETHDASADGICPSCARRHAVEMTVVCTQCKASVRDPAVMATLMHPAVTAFYYEHGVRHRFDTWAAFGRGQTLEETLVSREPFRLRITVPSGDDALQLTLDEDLAVVDVTESQGQAD